MDLLELSEKRRQAALRAIRASGVEEVWKSVGAIVNTVGSVRSGLIMKNLDIDFHIYTDEPMLEKSFAAMALLEKDPAIGNVQFRNLLDTGEECLEWHASYKDPEGAAWQLDMIHIRRGSTFDGVIERTTDAVTARLTPETRQAILRIKHDAPDGVKTPGIEVYYAVLSLGLRTYEEFAAWKQACPCIDLLGW
ncbi:MAG: phosphoglycerate mutase family protein, partial [Culturomica sp.]|nr:phosphoglycerate mutase family protein [Culturomica sp.]